MHGRVVHEETVLLFSMLSQRLAVIAQGCDEGGIVELVLLEPDNQPAEFVIGVRDFTVIEMISVLRAIRFGRVVGAMRIVEMQP